MKTKNLVRNWYKGVITEVDVLAVPCCRSSSSFAALEPSRKYRCWLEGNCRQFEVKSDQPVLVSVGTASRVVACGFRKGYEMCCGHWLQSDPNQSVQPAQ